MSKVREEGQFSKLDNKAGSKCLLVIENFPQLSFARVTPLHKAAFCQNLIR
jgi:magnesium-transporting ATPase (P-type)